MKPSHQFFKINRIDFNHHLKNDYRKEEMIKVLQFSEELMLNYFEHFLENFEFYTAGVGNDRYSEYKKDFSKILRISNELSNYQIDVFLQRYNSESYTINPHYLSAVRAGFELSLLTIEDKTDSQQKELKLWSM